MNERVKAAVDALEVVEVEGAWVATSAGEFLKEMKLAKTTAARETVAEKAVSFVALKLEDMLKLLRKARS